MNWFVVPPLRPKPTSGKYPDWKPAIAKNCRYQCVYCSISEGEYGGIDNFHVEHFRPKAVFDKLENDIDNLFVACAICNRFKSDEWPGEPHEKGATATFLSPAVANYHDHLEVVTGFSIQGRTTAGTYMVEQLFLNREQLLISRRYRTLLGTIKGINQFFRGELGNLAAAGAAGRKLVQQLAEQSLNVSQLQASLAVARSYEAGDTQRTEPRRKQTKRRIKTRRRVGL